ncbi:MAG TPA: alpha/beta hydrolase [Thermoleophilaceae bacterium]|nr:alpha/beta hydrolase [Thermoleophilaceae bacterium]
MAAFEARNGDLALRGESEGDGQAVLLMHGLTATRRYVVHGSHGLARAGNWTVAYDARGHGESDAPGDVSAYDYADLVSDLCAVMDGLEIERAVLAGVSMGAHVAVRMALENPSRVKALVLITPAYDGGDTERWEGLADALDEGGIDGFLEKWGAADVAERFREAALKNARQRLERHRDLGAVAAALRVVPSAKPFDGLDALADVDLPALVVGSRDEADPAHPLAVAEAYADRLPQGRLLVEEEGKSPLAWQGGRLAKAIAEFVEPHS